MSYVIAFLLTVWPLLANAEDEVDKAESTKASTTSAEISKLVDQLDYPELQVVPRASQRLRMEAASEEFNWYYIHWTTEIAGLATLYQGMTGPSSLRSDLSDSQKNDAKLVGTMTQMVGLGWIAAGVIVGSSRPYRTGMQNISKYNNEKGERAALLRERLAEEALERPAQIMRPLTLTAALSCFAMNAATFNYVNDQARISVAVSALISFLPVMFSDYSVNVYDKHLEYKKKIYGPLTSSGFGIDPKTQALYPTATLTWNF